MVSPRSRLEWPHDRCVLCLSQASLTYEHIIPGALGGRHFAFPLGQTAAGEGFFPTAVGRFVLRRQNRRLT